MAAKARPLGIEVDEVRFHRADLPFETSQAIYDRMKSERQREAKELRAQGFEWAQQIQAHADRDRTVILSEAQRAAAISRGEGEAEANRLLADSFGKDPKFYRILSRAADLPSGARRFRPDAGAFARRGFPARPQGRPRGAPSAAPAASAAERGRAP